MIRNLLITLIAISLLTMMVGCGEERNLSSGDDTQDIADEFGGFTATDEAAAFGDPALAAEMTDDEDFADEILLSPAVDSIVSDEEVGAYVLRLTWGSLNYDSTVNQLTDWTGSLTISRGAVIIRKIIRFEPGQDYILPRTEPTLIEWVSQTSTHYDGILVNIYIPPVDTSDTINADTPITVSFETEPFSVTYNITDLASLDTVYYLDDNINAVAVRGHKLEPMGCPRGFLEGRWGHDSTGTAIFYGRWLAANGYLAGHVKGYWGVDADSEWVNVFYGKYIDVFGHFEGLIKGVYIPNPGQGNGPSKDRFGGKFYGHIYDANGSAIGDLRGHYGLPRENSDTGMGFFAGRWKTYCNSAVAVDDGFDE
nr:hypothetical protein [candidate division Zixibacteria bacterium]